MLFLIDAATYLLNVELVKAVVAVMDMYLKVNDVKNFLIGAYVLAAFMRAGKYMYIRMCVFGCLKSA
jgi:hypothetical protein